MMLVGPFWNGIVSVFVGALIVDGIRDGEWGGWFLAVFLIPFVRIGWELKTHRKRSGVIDTGMWRITFIDANNREIAVIRRLTEMQARAFDEAIHRRFARRG